MQDQKNKIKIIYKEEKRGDIPVLNVKIRTFKYKH